jgi:hypothetical protein
VNDTGIYFVKTISPGGCIYNDTFDVRHKPSPVLPLPSDTTFCGGGSLLLNALTPVYNNYQWKNGPATSSLTVDSTGAYIITATDGNCSVTDTVNVTENVPFVLPLPSDTTYCAGGKVSLNATITQYNSYTWSTTEMTAAIDINAAGLYTIIATDGNCKTTDTVNVTERPAPLLNLPSDTVFCEGGKVRVDAFIPQYNSYTWSTLETTAAIDINIAGQYIITATDGNCKIRDTVNVTSVPPPPVGLVHDTVMCADIPIVVKATNPFYTGFNWSSGDASAQVTIKHPGLYTVQ